MKKYLCVFVCLFVLLPVFSQSNSKNDRIRELMNVTGAGKLGVQLLNNLITTYKRDIPSVPEEFWDQFMKEVNPNELTELVIPIYSKYFTEEEISQIVQFYKTPIGRKMVERLPLIMQDSYRVGADWGQKIGEKVAESLKEKGYMKSL